MAETQSYLFALRTTANREDQVMDFVTSNAKRKGLELFSVIRPHGMRGYIFLEAGPAEAEPRKGETPEQTKERLQSESAAQAEQAAFNVPYARGILAKRIEYKEIEHMIEQVKVEMNIQKMDIVEIISGPFKRENAKVTRIDRQKEEVVVELLDAPVPIPITVKMDAVKVIRRESGDDIIAEKEAAESTEESEESFE